MYSEVYVLFFGVAAVQLNHGSVDILSCDRAQGYMKKIQNIFSLLIIFPVLTLVVVKDTNADRMIEILCSQDFCLMQVKKAAIAARQFY